MYVNLPCGMYFKLSGGTRVYIEEQNFDFVTFTLFTQCSKRKYEQNKGIVLSYYRVINNSCPMLEVYVVKISVFELQKTRKLLISKRLTPIINHPVLLEYKHSGKGNSSYGHHVKDTALRSQMVLVGQPFSPRKY